MMIHRLLRTLMMILAGSFFVGESLADYTYLSPAQIEQSSDMIVLGEFIGGSSLRSASAGEDVNIGVIKVTEGLKGSVNSGVVLLMLPPHRSSGLKLSTDLTPHVGQNGLWYLVRKPNGLYFMSRPDRFVPMDRAKERIDRLRAKSKE